MLTAFRRLLQLLCLIALFAAGAVLFTVRPFVFASRDPSIPAHAKPERIQADIVRLATQFGSRSNDRPEDLSRVADDLLASMRATNARVSLQTFSVAGRAYQNVLSEHGFLNESGTVVIGAHYDTVPDSPGADDNATGVAALLELNRLFADYPPPCKVVLAAYPLEELLANRVTDTGSFIHASELKRAKEPLRLMISLESIGYFSAQPGSQQYPLRLLYWLYSNKGDFLAVVGKPTFSGATLEIKSAFARATALPVSSVNASRAVEGIDFSDHRSFWLHGFDAVMLTDTAMFRNPNYHKRSDLPESVDAKKVAEVADGVFEYLRSLGES